MVSLMFVLIDELKIVTVVNNKSDFHQDLNHLVASTEFWTLSYFLNLKHREPICSKSIA